MRVAKRPPGPGTEAGPAAGPAVPAALRSLKEFERLPLAEMIALVRGGPLLDSSLRERATIVVMLGRLRTCVPGLLAFALGLSYTAPVAWWRGALGGLLSLLIAFSANLHNAYTDIEEDCYNLPGRTWLLARLGLARLKWTLVGVSAFMAVAAVPLGLPFLALMLLAIAGLHQYSFPPLRFKAWPLAGLLVFAQAVGFPFLFGLLADPDAQLWLWSRSGARQCCCCSASGGCRWRPGSVCGCSARTAARQAMTCSGTTCGSRPGSWSRSCCWRRHVRRAWSPCWPAGRCWAGWTCSVSTRGGHATLPGVTLPARAARPVAPPAAAWWERPMLGTDPVPVVADPPTRR